jgi:outer membrane protein OmpA-like peptidoglycan-associated protein
LYRELLLHSGAKYLSMSCRIIRKLGFSFLLCLLGVGCAQQVNNTAKGALLGAGVGAGTGAIVGNQVGNSGAGIAIGAALGAVGGALTGNAMDRMEGENRALEGQLNQNQAQLDENRRLIDELRSRGADARSSNRGVVINLPDILFEFDRANLTPEAHRTIDEIEEVLRTVPDRALSVEGHTDSVGTVVYNKQLSERRARAVADKLARNGVPSARLNVTGFGEGSPIATNNTEGGRARNRRVEIIIENR